MRPSLTLAGAALAAVMAFASVAQAATFTITGGTDYVLPSGSGSPSYDPNPGTPGLGIGDTVRRNGTLGLSGPAKVVFTLMGYEAGDTNEFRVNGSLGFTNKTDAPGSSFALDLGAGTLPFSFTHVNHGVTVTNGQSAGYQPSLALFALSETSVYALFNDGYTGDKDYDDMVVRMDIAQVPLPAAAWLLLAGLGGLGAVSRRRAARV